MSKRAREAELAAAEKRKLPSSVVCSFSSQEGERAGESIDLPVSSTIKQCESLVNALLHNEAPLPYAFYVNDMEITSSLEETLTGLVEAGANVSFEDILRITFQPLSVFRVRPVTRCSETLPGHTDAVLHVSYSPDGRRLASGGGDTTVRFWNVSTSMPLHVCAGHGHHVLCTVWAPDGNTFVSADRSGEIRLWDPRTGVQRGSALRGHTKWVTSLSYEPLHSNKHCSRIASSSKDHTIKIWNVITYQCEATISGHADSVEAVRWGGKGLIYTASRDRTIKVWAVDGHGRSKHMLVRTLSGHAHRVNALALSCDYVLRTGSYELGDKEDDTTAGLVTPDERAEKALERYNKVVGEEGERLVSASDDFTLILWKPEEAKTPLCRMTGHQQAVNHIAFSPDTRYLASASFDKKVKLWCGKTGRFLATFTGHVASVYQVAWSADSAYVVSASKDSTVKVWAVKGANVSSSKALHTLSGHEDEVYALDWSPNGSQVASGSKDRTLRIWRH